jgi:uncharacterized protein with von Willebrand factor type A (vWA) domain
MMSTASVEGPAERAMDLVEAQMARFARLLRDNAFPVGLTDIADALRAVGALDARNISQVRQALRTLFASSRRDWRRFDDIFDAFWLGQARKRRSVVKQAGAIATGMGAVGRSGETQEGGTLKDYFDWSRDGVEAQGGAGERSSAGSSPVETLAKADFGKITDPDELQRLHALAEQWAARIHYRLSRRRRSSRRGRRPVLRRTFQRSVSTGGIPLKLFHSRRKPKPFKIVVFVDVSGSMELYSLFFTRFAYALTAHFVQTDVFIFHTRLVQITSALRTADPVKMMERMAVISHGWSGGTRIGEALATFNDAYASSLMTSRTLAIIVSDGFDTGPAEHLANELTKLKRRAKRLIWLNPLLGRAAYKPYAAAMAAALPHLDVFAPAHNLESLAALEEELARL